MPDASAEGTFVWDYELPFVSYLNKVFEHGVSPRTRAQRPSGRSNAGSPRTCFRSELPAEGGADALAWLALRP